MADYTFKRFDTYPPLQLELTDSNGPIDVTNALTIKLIMKSTTASPGVLITGNCSVVGSPTLGQVQYLWQTHDTDVADIYHIEVEITWVGGGIQTVPNSAAANKTVEIDPDLEDV